MQETLQLIINGAATLFTGQTFFWLVTGLVLGLVAGSIPGLSSTK